MIQKTPTTVNHAAAIYHIKHWCEATQPEVTVTIKAVQQAVPLIATHIKR